MREISLVTRSTLSLVGTPAIFMRSCCTLGITLASSYARKSVDRARISYSSSTVLLIFAFHFSRSSAVQETSFSSLACSLNEAMVVLKRSRVSRTVLNSESVSDRSALSSSLISNFLTAEFNLPMTLESASLSTFSSREIESPPLTLAIFSSKSSIRGKASFLKFLRAKI